MFSSGWRTGPTIGNQGKRDNGVVYALPGVVIVGSWSERLRSTPEEQTAMSLRNAKDAFLSFALARNAPIGTPRVRGGSV